MHIFSIFAWKDTKKEVKYASKLNCVFQLVYVSVTWWKHQIIWPWHSSIKRSKDGMMQYPEFRELLQCLNFWYQVFIQYDTNRTGYMEANELGRCIQQRLRMYRSRFCKTEEFSKLTHFAKNIIILWHA